MKRFMLTACAISAFTAALGARPSTTTHALRADKFVETIAVNTHVNYTDGAYANVKKVGDDLEWLGVRHVRDAAPGGAAPVSSYIYLGKRGVKFNFIVQDAVAQSLQQVESVEAESPGTVEAVEGFNEINNWPVSYAGLTGEAAGLASQKAVYAFVHGDTHLTNIPVYDLTGYDTSAVITRAGSADYVNLHVYPQNGEQPGYNRNGDLWIAMGFTGLSKFNLPSVMTEFGYFSMPQRGWYQIGVDEMSQAKGILNGLLDAVNYGISRTYIYELLDEKEDPRNGDSGMHYGLFKNDHSAKPAATALHNFISILKTNGEDHVNRAAIGRLSYALFDFPDSGRSLLLQKRDGRFLLVLWNEVPFWNRATGTPINATPEKVHVDLGGTASLVRVYDPMIASTPIAAQQNLRQMAVSVPDHPILVEVTFPH